MNKRNKKNVFNVCTGNPCHETPELSRREFSLFPVKVVLHTHTVRLNPFLKNLPVYQPGRPIEEVARELNLPADSIIKVASNENPFGPSPLALAALQKAIAGVHLYPDGNAFYLKQKLAAKLGIEPANLILGNGSNEIIEFVAHALLEEGVASEQNVVVSQYCFAIYPIVAKMFGAKVITVPAKKYGHDLPQMLRAITPQTRIVFVANPNNPTGTLAPREELIQFVNEVPDDVLLVMDEAYIEFLEDAVDLIPLIQLGVRKNLILMRTFSKIYGLAGLRVGFGIGVPEFVSALEKIRQPFNVNSLAQIAAAAALDDHDHVRQTRANNFAGLDFFERALREMGVEFVPSFANFILARVGDGLKVFEAMQRQGVIVRPMGGYLLPEWIRFSIGTPAENERSLGALKGVLASMR
jgi:histidinol-phosphate aminotransferase